MKTDLRLTDTNAASDSKGGTWGLEGSLFWWLVGGIGAAITVFFVLLVPFKQSLALSFGVALVPLALCLAYVFGLRQGKPPGYDRDWFEYIRPKRPRTVFSDCPQPQPSKGVIRGRTSLSGDLHCAQAENDCASCSEDDRDSGLASVLGGSGGGTG